MRTDMHSIIQNYGKVYEQYSEFMWTEIHSIIWEKYSEFMWIEICSIIQKMSIPMFSLCDKNQYRHKPWIFFLQKFPSLVNYVQPL